MSKDLINIPGGEDLTMPPMAGLAAVALNMALNYLDMTVVKDGQMYQTLKMEGKEVNPVALETAFHYAKQIEIHLMGASDRFANIIIDAIGQGVNDMEHNPEEPMSVGAYLGDVFFKKNLSSQQVAEGMGVSHSVITSVLDSRKDLTQDLADQLETYYNIPAAESMEVQRKFTEYFNGESDSVPPKE